MHTLNCDVIKSFRISKTCAHGFATIKTSTNVLPNLKTIVKHYKNKLVSSPAFQILTCSNAHQTPAVHESNFGA